MRQSLADAGPADAEIRGEVAESYYEIGRLLDGMGRAAAARESLQKALTLREALSAADPMNTEMRRAVTQVYAALGESYARWAGEARAPAARRAAGWRAARAWYQRGLEVVESLRGRVGRHSKPHPTPEAFAAEIARCDRALAGY